MTTYLDTSGAWYPRASNGYVPGDTLTLEGYTVELYPA